jgi:RNA recognition motif-containing protein
MPAAYGFSVWIGGLSEQTRTRDVEDFFKGFGRINDISLKQKFGK